MQETLSRKAACRGRQLAVPMRVRVSIGLLLLALFLAPTSTQAQDPVWLPCEAVDPSGSGPTLPPWLDPDGSPCGSANGGGGGGGDGGAERCTNPAGVCPTAGPFPSLDRVPSAGVKHPDAGEGAPEPRAHGTPTPLSPRKAEDLRRLAAMRDPSGWRPELPSSRHGLAPSLATDGSGDPRSPAGSGRGSFSMAKTPVTAWQVSIEGIVAGSAVLAASFLFSGIFVWPPAWTGPARMVRALVLQHSMRRAIMAQLEAAPGLTCGELGRRLGVHHTTAAHHLRILQRFGCIRADGGDAWTRYGVREGAETAAPLADLAVLRRPGNLALLAVAEGAGTLRLRDLAWRLGLRRNTAHYRAHGLVRRGLLAREHGAFRVAERGRHALAAWRHRSGPDRGKATEGFAFSVDAWHGPWPRSGGPERSAATTPSPRPAGIEPG